MLKVSLHSSVPTKATAFNVLGRLDIGYEKLAAMADYKALMFTTGIGEQPPVALENYPRWSASVWDLISRFICLTFNRVEAIEPQELPREGKPAFIENLTAVIEHWPDGLNQHVATVGTAHIRMAKRKGHYWATFESDLQSKLESSLFVHTPLGINPWDLLARAYAWTVHEQFVLPSRPKLCVPLPVQDGDRSLVALDTVPDPARTGLVRWMVKKGQPFSQVSFLAGDCVTEAQFVQFLEKAI